MAKKLIVGDSIPDLKATPINHSEEFDLKKTITDKPVVIIFSRYFGCPICQSDFDKLLSIKDKIKAKASLVYVTQSTPESAKKFIARKDGVDFPILCDPAAPYPLYQAFNIGNLNLLTLAKMAPVAISGKYKHGENEGHEKQSPADFIIGKDGKLLHANYSLLNVGKITEILDTL